MIVVGKDIHVTKYKFRELSDNDVLVKLSTGGEVRCTLFADCLFILSTLDDSEEVLINVENNLKAVYRHFRGYSIDHSFKGMLSGVYLLNRSGYRVVEGNSL